MTTGTALSKSELLEALRQSERDLLDRLGGLPPEDFERGRYEGGWNGRQILAHVASIEWTYHRLFDIAAQRASGEKPAGSAPAAGGFRGGVNDYNQRQVQKRAGASVADLLEEFRRNRARTIAAVEEAPDALLAVEVSSAGGNFTGPLSHVLYGLAVLHVVGHLNDIAGPAGQASA